MGVEPFRDNWSYLKVEMNWLERILLNAVAKARAIEAKTQRHSKTNADRSSRDWWIGLMNFEKVGYDSPNPASNPPSNPAAKSTQSYQQQLDARIRQSQAVGIQLALPDLCDRYALSQFERQALLLAIAPEVHRRYGELCGYLSAQGMTQGDRQAVVGLPTVDLALRLFCRDDQAWRLGRSQLLSGPLVTEGVLMSRLLTTQSFLQQPLKVNPYWVSELLGSTQGNAKSLVSSPAPLSPAPLSQLERTLPAKLKTQVKRTIAKLKVLSNHGSGGSGVVCTGLDRLCLDPEDWQAFYGTIAKTLKMQPELLDLESLDMGDLSLMSSAPTIATEPSKMLVIRSSGRILSRNSPLTQVEKVRFIRQMRSEYALLLFDLTYPIALEQVWRSWMVDTFYFPLAKP